MLVISPLSSSVVCRRETFCWQIENTTVIPDLAANATFESSVPAILWLALVMNSFANCLAIRPIAEMLSHQTCVDLITLNKMQLWKNQTKATKAKSIDAFALETGWESVENRTSSQSLPSMCTKQWMGLCGTWCILLHSGMKLGE